MYTKFIHQTTIKTTILFGICLIIASGCGQNRLSENPNQTLVASIAFQPPPPPPPPERGEPTGRGQGGAGRGCDAIALVPTTTLNNNNYLWGLTVAERPQFWFSLPRDLTAKDAIEFRLQDNQGKEIYKSRLEKINNPKGLIRFTLPQQAPALQINKTYNWSFKIECDFQTTEDRPVIAKGTIKRVAISENLKNQLAKTKTTVEKANAYAQNSIWFDAVTTLAINKDSKKEPNITNSWSQLLEQVNLKPVIPQPVTKCCTN